MVPHDHSRVGRSLDSQVPEVYRGRNFSVEVTVEDAPLVFVVDCSSVVTARAVLT